MSSDRNLAKAPAGEKPTVPPRRELRDPRAMRALTHPVRLELLRVLELEGQLTATQAGELISEPPNTCSFHFRQLAKYGFVEEAGPVPGRARPWRLVTARMHFTHLHADTDTAMAASELESMMVDTYLARLATFYATRSALPTEWQEVTGGSQATLHLTPAELRQVDQEIMAIIDRYSERMTNLARRPADSQPVEVLLFAYLPATGR